MNPVNLVPSIRSARLCALCFLLACVPGAQAQLVTGRVLEEGTGRRIDAVNVELIDSAGDRRASALTDTAGAFRILAPIPGPYRLRLSRIGFTTLQTAPITAALGMRIDLELRLAPSAVALDPLTVIGRSTYSAGRLQEYYERAMWSRRTGLGRVLLRDDIERMRPPRTSVLLQNLQPRGGCIPTVFIDGMPVPDVQELDARLTPDVLEGAEFYNNASQIPRPYDCCDRCAVALFWTRRDIDDARPLTMKRALFAVGIILGVLLFLRL